MKVHIIGRGDGWEDAPGQGVDGVTIGLNTVIIYRDLDVAVDIHNDIDGDKERHHRQTSLEDIAKIVERVKETGAKFYTQREWDNVSCTVYPLEEIIDYFDTDFFGGGCDYCTALALYSGAEELHYWGFNFLGRADYMRQLPSACYWVGRAVGMGVRVKIHGEPSHFMRTLNKLRYGYEEPQCRSW